MIVNVEQSSLGGVVVNVGRLVTVTVSMTSIIMLLSDVMNEYQKEEVLWNTLNNHTRPYVVSICLFI